MKFIIEGKEHNFVIWTSNPTEEELKTVDGPEIEGQMSDEDVILDRRIEELLNSLKYGYKLRVLEEEDSTWT